MFTMGRAKHDAMASTDDESVKTLNVESDNYKKNQIMNKDAYALEICEKPPTEESSDEEVNGGQITPPTMRRRILSPCSISREKSATYDNSPRCNVTTRNPVIHAGLRDHLYENRNQNTMDEPGILPNNRQDDFMETIKSYMQSM